MTTQAINFTTPVGRLVQGSVYKANDKDAEGRPLLVKNGPNAGKARQEWYVALAIPKERDPATGQFKHWAATDWGSKIWQAGHNFMAQAGQMPSFAWKVRDGDSTVPNKKGKRPCDQEGFPGCWVVGFSSGFPPQTYTLVGQQAPVALAQADAINLGDYVQINANVNGNGAMNQPGVFINFSMICLLGYGERIFVGPDVSEAGFGGLALPPGASMTPHAAPAGALPTAPVGAGMPPPAMTPPAPGYAPPPIPGYAPAAPMPGYTATTQMPAGAIPTPVVPMAPMMPPNPTILQPPPNVPAAPRARTMTPKAQGATYEQMRGAGWTDEQLLANGMMVP